MLRTGTRTESVLRLSERVLAKYKDKGLLAVTHMSADELSEVQGIGSVKAATVLAAVEIGRRLSVRAAEKREKIHGPEDAAAYAMPHFRYERKEHFAVLLMNTKNHVIGMPTVSTGSLSASIVHPREVFQAAIRQSAASMILVHNHPSGDPTPSEADISMTLQVQEAAQVLGITLHDHLIIGKSREVSFRSAGYL